jgi:hypothetical protein
MSASFLSVAHPSSRLTIGAIAFALLAVGMTVPVFGRDYCNTTTPALDEVVTCVGASATDITVPVGANVVSVVVSGAGGGAGHGTGGAGGTGAKVQAEFLISSVSNIYVVAGLAGGGGGASNAGLGGGYSAIYRGASSAIGNVLVVAGAGGGGQGVASGTADIGGIGGNGAALGTAAGGNGAVSDGASELAGGADGSGDGGSGGTFCGGSVGAVGQTWIAGGAGGTGYSPPAEVGDATVVASLGGSGGAGYGGGGGGGEYGSGGAGASYANATYLNGAAIFSAAGGAGGTVSSSLGNTGNAGSVVLTFRSSVGSGFSAASSSEPGTRQIVWQGAGADFSSTDATMNTWVKVPTNAVSGREGDRLLGWSTMADFPVDIALRQINNGWGAYEIFNENGSIRGVFIPVGSYVLVNADDTLHAIWSSGQLMPRC